jgi:hypothetical protein
MREGKRGRSCFGWRLRTWVFAARFMAYLTISFNWVVGRIWSLGRSLTLYLMVAG